MKGLPTHAGSILQRLGVRWRLLLAFFGISAFAVIAAALRAGCGTLWSEDMQDGMVIDGRLRIVDPFRAP